MIKTNVKPTGIKILLWGIAALVAVNLLSRFDILNLTGLQPDLLTIISILFVATEIGVVTALRGKKKLDGVQWFGTAVIFLSFLALLAGWFGMSLGFLDAWKGSVELALLVYIVIEIFR